MEINDVFSLNSQEVYWNVLQCYQKHKAEDTAFIMQYLLYFLFNSQRIYWKHKAEDAAKVTREGNIGIIISDYADSRSFELYSFSEGMYDFVSFSIIVT